MEETSTSINQLRNNEDPSLVYLHVYDVNDAGVNNPFFRWLCFGSTLSCVQVQGHEYIFCELGGVMDTCLMNARMHSPPVVDRRRSILIGRTQFDEAGVREIIQQLRRNSYTIESYNLITHNCDHFSDRLSRLLTGGNRIPWWVNPINATFGLFCRCLLPGDDGHEPNSADHDNDGSRNDHDDHGGDDEEHDDSDHDNDADDDDFSEPPYWEILRREMPAMSRPTATQQEEDQAAAPSAFGNSC